MPDAERAGAIVMANHIGVGAVPHSTMPVQLQRGLFRRDSRPQAQHYTPTPHTHMHADGNEACEAHWKLNGIDIRL